MPFIDARVAPSLTATQKEELKREFGRAISAFGKGENWLMVQIADSCELWRGGEALDDGAYLAVSMVGASGDSACAAFSADVCAVLARVAGLDPAQVYLTVTSVDGSHWGWNGGTF